MYNKTFKMLNNTNNLLIKEYDPFKITLDFKEEILNSNVLL